ncbi:MAG: adenylyltransferase/cytidyltransferase family protein [Candidatus Pacearchaeota archaeon]
MKKIFVSGCFDLLHSGHIEFLNQAASYGELYVSIGSDKTILKLKEKKPVFNQDERKFMIESLKGVKKAFIAKGEGLLDFLEELKEIKPDCFIVNEEGHIEEKEELCKRLGIEYKILKRIPKEGLPQRSATKILEGSVPYRIDLAGGWLDQPFVSELSSGPVIVISIEPEIEFSKRSGMATSTREIAKGLVKKGLILHDEENAKILFGLENPPGKKEIAGSQDSLGIVLPGLSYLYYKGTYWPEKIVRCTDEEILSWLEEKIYLIPLGSRENGFDVLSGKNLNIPAAKKLSESAEKVFQAILRKDVLSLGKYFTESFNAQINLFPDMVNKEILDVIEKYKSRAFGWKISGAGGGGYLILISENPIKDALKIKIRRGLFFDR